MKKYIALSALLHTLIFALVLSQTEPPQIEKKAKTVVIEVLKVEEPKKEEPKPLEKPKPIEKPKPVPKEQPKKEEVVTQKEAAIAPKFEAVEPTPQKETQKEEPQAPAPPPKPTISQEEIQNAKDIYLAKLRKVIEEKKTYPKNARRLKQSGVSHVRFTILKDGTITNTQIAQTSSFEILDNATLNLLKEIAKTEPFPKELSDDMMVIVLPIEYSLRD